MPPVPATFAIPGDIDTVSGGYFYDRRLLAGLRAAGREVRHLPLPGGFPDPTAAGMAAALEALAAEPPGRPVLVDGLALGAMDADGLARMRAPLVALVHHPLALESGLPAARAAALRTTEAAALARAAQVVVPSPHIAGILARDYGVDAARITAAPPGFDPRPPMPGVAKDDPPLILSVGLLHPRKGHDVLIRALAAVADLPWQAVIAGAPQDAAHAADLRRLAADSGLAGRVTLPGLVSEDALARLYARASVFALATRYEGYGIVLGEAMAAGLPVVATRAGAVPDTLPRGAGLLVPPDSPQAFADALRRVLGAPGLRARLAAGAAAAGAALPGWETTAATVGAVLDRAAAG